MIAFQRDGALLVASFTQPEAELLSSLAEQIAGMLDELATPPVIDDPDAAALYASVGMGGSTALSDDPAIARLLPDAYASEEAQAASEFRGLTERSLASRKVANARLVVASLEAAGGEVRLDASGVQAWLRTITDIRLTIAARLGIDDDDEPELDSDASIVLRDVYDWLAWVLETLLDAEETTPDETAPEPTA
jgi:hypothetical protein